MTNYSAQFTLLIDGLRTNGYAAVPAFLDAITLSELAAECRKLNGQSMLKPAAVGLGVGRQYMVGVRGDSTYWFDSADLTAAQSGYWRRMQELRVVLNRSLWLGLEELEAHYAYYAPGKAYARHLDCFRGSDARVLSSVLYLNSDWQESEGGALRLFLRNTNSSHLDIYPRNGTLVLFLSAEFEHEVLPATRDRFSIAGWFRRR